MRRPAPRPKPPVTRRVSTALLDAARRRADEMLQDPAVLLAWREVAADTFQPVHLVTDNDWIVAFLLWDAAGRDFLKILEKKHG